MPTAHILLDVGERDITNPRALRIGRMVRVLQELGYIWQTYGRDICNPERSNNLETQVGTYDGWQADFADSFSRELKEKGISRGDLIIATEPWHNLCFRGMLSAQKGRFMGVPVVELWVDYPDSFAVHRVFATRYAMYTTAAYEDRAEWTKAWITARPYYQADSSSVAHPCQIYNTEPFSMKHLEAGCRGIPVSAPDWGTWGETIKHGVTGILYRSLAGRDKAVLLAGRIPQARIVESINETFSLTVAANQLKGYLGKLSNG